MVSIVPLSIDYSELGITEAEADALVSSISAGEMSKNQSRLLSQLTKKVREAIGEQYVRAVPKSKITEWTGRQWKTIQEQSVLFQTPALSKPSVNIPEMLHQEADWRAANKVQIRRAMTGKINDELTPLERLRTLQAETAEFKLEALRKNLIPLQVVEAFVNDLMDMYKRVVQQLYDNEDTPAAALIEKYQEDVSNAFATRLQDAIEATEQNDARVVLDSGKPSKGRRKGRPPKKAV